MTYADWAEVLARNLLAGSLPRRWAHSQGVAATAGILAPLLRDAEDLVTAAAWLHDVGYAPGLHMTGFHPLDGARYLRDIHQADPMLCRLVAHHSCAINEAAERGLAADLAREFQPAPHDLTDALIYCDMGTSPDGHHVTVERRLNEIRVRYGPGSVVSRALARSAPKLTSAVSRVRCKLARAVPSAGPDGLAMSLAAN
ncbi:MAG TPA: HD domain-containing protein [Streptosporangiaceae bacterium]|nr:HD domain-containing protein [Streptosporangiaceae bacterium]